MLSIGDKVSFVNELGDSLKGTLSAVLSDSYDDVRLEDGEVEYWSKKTKKYVPVRAKHENSIFFEVDTLKGVEYVFQNELV